VLCKDKAGTQQVVPQVRHVRYGQTQVMLDLPAQIPYAVKTDDRAGAQIYGSRS